MSSWEKAFDAFTWKNKSESTETPLDASHLNRINTAVNTIDDRVITLQDDLDDKVDKNGTDRLMTAAEGTKLSEIEAGAEVNVLEGVQIDGDDLPISDKKVNIDLGSYIYKSTQLPYQDTIKVNDAVATNAEDVKIKFEPVQDLHGYGYPWVGGAEKNKLPCPTSAGTKTGSGITLSADTNGVYTINGTATAEVELLFDIPSFTIPTSIGQGGNGCFYIFNDFTSSGVVVLYNGSTQVDYWSFSEINKKNSVYSLMSNKIINKIGVRIVSGQTFTNAKFSPMFTNDGTTDATFEPYSNICFLSGKSSLSIQWSGDSQGSLLPIQLGGTYYGGVLDVTTGVLTEDRAIVDLGTLNWEKLSNSRFEANLNGFKYETNAYATPNMKCSAYKALSYATAATAEHAINSYTAGSYVQIRDISHTNTSASDFKTAMSGIQLVYELATPVTYNLTPHDIALYLNNNKLWSPTSGCQVSLKYKASELSGKADMVVNATPDDLVALDENGNIIDTGVSYVKNKVVDYASSISVSDALAEEATVKIKVEPYQDLHGYSKPWAGGCGKNLLPMTVANIKALNTSGTWTGNQYARNGVIFTILTDNSNNVTGIKVVGTPTAEFEFTITSRASGNDTFLPAGSYILYQGTSDTTKCRMGINTQSGTTLAYSGSTFTISTLERHTVWVTFYNGVAVDLTLYPQIEAGSTITSFEPYSNISPIYGRNESVLTLNGGNIFFDLGGVQYGGVINNDGTMTVDRTIGSVDSTWTFTTYGGKSYINKTISDLYVNHSNRKDPFSSMCPFGGYGGVSSFESGKFYQTTNNTGDLYLYDSACASKDAYLAKYGDCKICYYLATPTTIQLSPQQITLLKGSNTLSASSGDVRLEYRASVIDELESQIADILARLNALEEV